MKVLSIFGTRPEAIKMVPVVKKLAMSGADSIICVTAQHRKMLDGVLEFFDIVPAIDLDLMQEAQTLTSLTSRVLAAVGDVLDQIKPDLIVVQGDTTTAMGANGRLSADHERGVHWADASSGIEWPIAAAEVVVSERDQGLPPLCD